MKRIIAVFMVVVISLFFVSCNGKMNETAFSDDEKNTSEAIPKETSPTTDGGINGTEGTEATATDPTDEAAPNEVLFDDNVTLSITADWPILDWDLMVNNASLIVSVEVTDEKEPFHTNPEGKEPDGYTRIINAINHKYTARVNKVYKGNVSVGDDITVNIFNSYGVPYGWDPERVESDFSDYYLTVGEECILFLTYPGLTATDENSTPDNTGYDTIYRQAGVYRKDENGVYQGAFLTYDMPFTEEELPAIIEKYKKTE